MTNREIAQRLRDAIHYAERSTGATLGELRGLADEIDPQPRKYTPDERHIGCEIVGKRTKRHYIFDNDEDNPNFHTLYLGPAKLAMIPWNGGECPLKNDGVALVVDRDGREWVATPAHRWSHNASSYDIVEYREIETVGVE